ncbi:MAG: hypothetical protein JXR83_13695 [Deltaproteobacteria bacterium]|nr:hypothetical protein [Deltaproteobacteria bacterium]
MPSSASWLPCLLLLSTAAACTDNRYRIVLVYPDQAARDRAASIEITFGQSTSCDELSDFQGSPDLTCRAGEQCDPGPRSFGQVAVLARVRDSACLAYLEGCVVQQLEMWSGATIRVPLAAAGGSGCRVGEVCSAGLCQARQDGVDAAIGDGGVLDGAVADSAIADSAVADGAVADGAVADGAAADGAAADGAATDGAAADGSTACPANSVFCLDDETLARCNASGQVAGTFDCPHGCNDTATPARCRGVAASNIDRALLPFGQSQLAVDATKVLDTDHATLGGVELPAAAYAVVTQTGQHVPDILVLRYATFDVASGATLHVVGARALAVVANAIQLDGVIDASATDTAEHQSSIGGPGGFNGGARGQTGAGACGGQAGGGLSYENGGLHIAARGGGGGGHGGAGGNGGYAYVDNYGDLTEGTGGTMCGNSSLTPLVGGSGGAGESEISDVTQPQDRPGSGGGGGGAVQLVGDVSITINGGGGIDAAGGGGGRTGSAGGAGGGAGGAILLESPQVVINAGALLVANGGGGSGGDGLADSSDFGEAGQNGTRDRTRASGGPGSQDGDQGGMGGAGTYESGDRPSSGSDYHNPAGGGGGAAGRIRINASATALHIDSGAVISPSDQAGACGNDADDLCQIGSIAIE